MVYQLANLRMLEFYYDFLDRYFDRHDFKLIQMDTDSSYITISTDWLEDIICPELHAVACIGQVEQAPNGAVQA